MDRRTVLIAALRRRMVAAAQPCRTPAAADLRPHMVAAAALPWNQTAADSTPRTEAAVDSLSHTDSGVDHCRSEALRRTAGLGSGRHTPPDIQPEALQGREAQRVGRLESIMTVRVFPFLWVPRIPSEP